MPGTQFSPALHVLFCSKYAEGLLHRLFTVCIYRNENFRKVKAFQLCVWYFLLFHINKKRLTEKKNSNTHTSTQIHILNCMAKRAKLIGVVKTPTENEKSTTLTALGFQMRCECVQCSVGGVHKAQFALFENGFILDGLNEVEMVVGCLIDFMHS